MIRKAEIIVEEFDEGITIHYESEDGSVISKGLALKGNEEQLLGKEVWDDVSDIFGNVLTDKVRIKIECVAL